MASTSTPAGTVRVDVPSRAGDCGNSSLLCPLNLYFPSPAEISTSNDSGLISNTTGISENVFRVSSSIFAGMVTEPGSSALVSGMETVMVVSRSDAVTNNKSSFSSNKKSSRIGRVLDELITPLRADRFRSNTELDTINFIRLPDLI